MPDSMRVAAAFNDRAADYDRHVSVQKKVVNNLTRHIETHLTEAPEKILDVGTGTGALLQSLRRLYPEASLFGLDPAHNMCLLAASKLGNGCLAVNGYAEKLPFKSAAFDLAVSASALQWVENIADALWELRRILKPGGTLCIAFFCDGTLAELQNCFRETVCGRGMENSGLTDRLHRFRTAGAVKEMLEVMDFEQVVLNCEVETDWHDDLPSLLRSIKNIGAGTVTGGRVTGLGWRGIINRMSRLYEEHYGDNGRIPATYKVLYLYARAPEATESQLFSGPADL